VKKRTKQTKSHLQFDGINNVAVGDTALDFVIGIQDELVFKPQQSGMHMAAKCKCCGRYNVYGLAPITDLIRLSISFKVKALFKAINKLIG